MSTGDLVLLRPFWLLALLPVALAALWVRRRAANGGWERLVDPPLLRRMQALGLVGTGAAPRLAPFVLAALLALALAGPARLRASATAFAPMDPVVLILDLSPSITRGAALADAQAAAALVLQSAQGRPVGLMLYAADAYLASAPTSDAATLESLIAVLDAQTMPVQGSRPDIALASARELFLREGHPGVGGVDLILISDGGGVSPPALEEAQRLAEAGARLWTLGLASTPPEGAPHPDPEALASLAAAAGGAHAPASAPRPLLAQIEAARLTALARSERAGTAFDDLGRWLLLAALIPALALFRRRA
ncbi:vWA domain-containing protein [Frigidibacter sp.]|uniref:vWA domain-containing protein n=1 Tax=Frigidibacter sp. TaxID=2586418 RepID=UPI002734DBCC|nr:vWA domain-containing protein [Frigidibacter sp.]MDP3341405.1 vWA domain-containing protein [Frigidibacter sp.]